VKVTTQFHLVPTLIMKIGLPLLPLYAFIKGTKTIVHVPLLG